MARRDKPAVRPVPTKQDWGDAEADTEDLWFAYCRFAGRTREEAVELMHRAATFACADDLHWMPPVPFRYYLLALCDYVVSDRALQNPDRSSIADAFLRLVEENLENSPLAIAPVIDEVMPAVEFVAARQKRYDAPSSAYGSFGRRLRRIRGLAAATARAGSTDPDLRARRALRWRGAK